MNRFGNAVDRTASHNLVRTYAMDIVQEGLEHLDEYERVPISFMVASRLDLQDIRTEIPVEPYLKDYDAEPENRPSQYPSRFDTANWESFSVFWNDLRIGGCILAFQSPDFDMLEGRSDLAVMVDLRVHPEFRRHSVGRVLFARAKAWADLEGCTELRVETQDINVPACRFYERMGAELIRVEPGAYGADIDEAKLIWSLAV